MNEIQNTSGKLTVTVTTGSRTELVDITADVNRLLASAKETGGRLCHVYVPHTTAGITINENADPTVPRDIVKVLNTIIPWEADYQHLEGNSAAHIKSSLVGASQTIAIENNRLVLGRWQGLFFCEFDGPRTRTVQIRLF